MALTEQTIGLVPGAPGSPLDATLPQPATKAPVVPQAAPPPPPEPQEAPVDANAVAGATLTAPKAPGSTEQTIGEPAPVQVAQANTTILPGAPNSRIDNPFQQKMMALREQGYTWEQIDATVTQLRQNLLKQGYDDATIAKTFGLQPADFAPLQQGITQNAADSPPKAMSNWDQFTDSALNYSGLGELAHLNVPKAQQPATDFWGHIVQTGGVIAGSVPETLLGARLGATAGFAVGGPWGAAIGGVGGAAVGMFLDAFVRQTYADAIKDGKTGVPNFADKAATHAVDAVKETAPAVAAMAVGGPAGEVVAPYVGAWIARFGMRPVAELATMTAVSGVIQGKLPSWEETIDNAIILTAMHGSVAVAGGVKAGVEAAGDKLENMTVNSAAKALVDNWSVTNETPSQTTARINGETRIEGLTAKAGTVTPEVTQAWTDSALDDYSPQTRSRWFNSAVTDGVETANALLEKSGGSPERFNELRALQIEKDFQIDPAKYDGDIDRHLTRFDSEPPTSPEMADAAKARMEDVAGRPVPPTISLQATTPTMSGLVRGVARSIRTIFNPENMDSAARDAVALIRAEGGYGARATTQAGAAVTGSMRNEVNAVGDIAPLINYIEGRSQGAVLPVTHGGLQKAADLIRTIIETRRDALKAQGSPTKGFIDNYWSHLWTDKKAARAFLEGKAEGEWPTVGEAMREGLVPKTDPISAVLEYAAGMDRALAMNGIRDTAVQHGDWGYFKKGDQPAGWTEVKGPHADQVQSFIGEDGKATSVTKTAYAPDGFARVYNNFISKGIGDIAKDYQDVYDYAQRTSNAITALKLALSGYHAMTITLRSFSNGMAQGIDELASGHPIMALKTFGTLPLRPVTGMYRGLNAQRIYQGKAQGTDQDNRVIDFITEAGGRMAGNRHAVDVQYSQIGSYVTSLFKHGFAGLAHGGSLPSELLADAKQAVSSPLGIVPVAARHLGRVMETLGQPLFQKYIPWLKNAATMEHVGSWLERNPTATHGEALKATRYIVDQMDNRFGEMIHDNIFANKMAKQAGSLIFLSWSWTVGEDIRAMGGGLVDSGKFVKNIVTGRGPIEWTPKMSYLIAEPLVTAMAGAIYQYLKTGQWPASPLDFFAPKTGGTVKGKAERAQVPGVMKDVFAFYDHPTDEVGNKMSPFLHAIRELWTNKDWKEDPIAPINVPGASGYDIAKALALHAAETTSAPISVSNFAEQSAGSKFSPAETILGFRQPTPLLRDPAAHIQSTGHFAAQAWRNKVRADARANQSRQAP